MGADQSVAGGALPGQMTFLTKHAQLEFRNYPLHLDPGFGIALNGEISAPFHFLQSSLILKKAENDIYFLFF
jgi:hypothetical protein